MKITDNIKNIIDQGSFEENIFFLPKIQLDRKDYLEVNKILESLWGKWNRSKKWHVFNWTQEELESALFEVLEAGETQTLDEIKKQFQFFETPQKVAQAMIDELELKESDIVLEPSAWKWAISDLIIKNKKTLVELNKECFEVLKEKEFYNDDCRVINRDFLECYAKDLWKFNKIIANPPFSKNQDVKHILHMYDLLEKWWRIVSVASSMIQHKTTKLHEELKALNPEFIEVEEWAFKESGTMVNTVIVILNK